MNNTEELQPDDVTSCVIQIIANPTVLAQTLSLLTDIRHVVCDGEEQEFRVKVNSEKGKSTFLMTINNLEVQDYKPQYNVLIN